ncbi:hypothetical protein RRG08_030169 [Elysia crispata]|uniref:Uncharacterized protein n=1 Tax=Elysia crispata TaxID=231223 RepID=A0AAE0ZT45_9GAST|nr:hypothetical protein RRG08_030169 [Elysia crispata]
MGRVWLTAEHPRDPRQTPGNPGRPGAAMIVPADVVSTAAGEPGARASGARPYVPPCTSFLLLPSMFSDSPPSYIFLHLSCGNPSRAASSEPRAAVQEGGAHFRDARAAGRPLKHQQIGPRYIIRASGIQTQLGAADTLLGVCLSSGSVRDMRWFYSGQPDLDLAVCLAAPREKSGVLLNPQQYRILELAMSRAAEQRLYCPVYCAVTQAPQRCQNHRRSTPH